MLITDNEELQFMRSRGVGSIAVTLDPLKKASGIALSGGNLTAGLAVAGFYPCVLSTTGHSSGKFYFEAQTHGTNAFDNEQIGVTFDEGGTYMTPVSNSVNGAAMRADGQVGVNATTVATIQSYVQGNTIAVAVDLTGKLIWFRTSANTNWNNSGTANPATGTGGISLASFTGVPVYAAVTEEGAGNLWTFNFGNSAYALTPPAGFNNW